MRLWVWHKSRRAREDSELDEELRFHLQGVLGAGADGDADAVAVLRPPLESTQDQHVQSALQKLDAVHGSRLSTTLDLGGGEWLGIRGKSRLPAGLAALQRTQWASRKAAG
jgi:hypothetical protein